MPSGGGGLSALDGALVSSAALVLGAAVILGVTLMREFRWTVRPWHPPESTVDGEIPPGAYHLRMHTVKVDRAETEALVAAVGEFPPSVRPLAVSMDPASELLVKLLEKEGSPVMVAGPGGCLLRVFHRLPKDHKDDRCRESGTTGRKYCTGLNERNAVVTEECTEEDGKAHCRLSSAGYYGAGLSQDEAFDRAERIREKIDRVAGFAAPSKTILYALPARHGVESFPFGVDASAAFPEAYSRAKSAPGGRLRLLAFHSGLSVRGCP